MQKMSKRIEKYARPSIILTPVCGNVYYRITFLHVSGLPQCEWKIDLMSVSKAIILPFHCWFICEYLVKMEVLLLNNVRREVEKILLSFIFLLRNIIIIKKSYICDILKYKIFCLIEGVEVFIFIYNCISEE